MATIPLSYEWIDIIFIIVMILSMWFILIQSLIILSLALFLYMGILQYKLKEERKKNEAVKF